MTLDGSGPALTFAVSKTAGVHVLAVFGEVDAAVQPAFRAALDEAVAGANSPLMIDLTGVSNMGSLGITDLITTQKKMTARPDKLFVVVNDPRMRRSLSVLGLDRFFDLYVSAEDAMSAAVKSLS